MRKDTRYPTEELLGSKALSQFQPDFAQTLLIRRSYTLGEALRILNQFYEKAVR